MTALARAGNILAVSCNVLLLALLLTWAVWLLPPPNSLAAPLLVILALPLLIPIRGLLHGRRYTHAWTSLLAMAYFVHGVAAAGAPGLSRAMGVAEVALSLGLFTGCVIYAKLTR